MAYLFGAESNLCPVHDMGGRRPFRLIDQKKTAFCHRFLHVGKTEDEPAGVSPRVELLLYLPEKVLDPFRLIDRFVVKEFNSRNETKFELLADSGTDESQRALQSCEN